MLYKWDVCSLWHRLCVYINIYMYIYLDVYVSYVVVFISFAFMHF